MIRNKILSFSFLFCFNFTLCLKNFGQKIVQSHRTIDCIKVFTELRKMGIAMTTGITILITPIPYQSIYFNAWGENLPTTYGDTSQHGRIETLIPIVKLKLSVERALLQVAKIADIRKELKAIPHSEKEFKKLFDSFSEPVSYKQQFLDKNAFLVYCSKGFDGPGRPNIEEDDVDSQKQKVQYGYRNEAWLAMDEAISEIEYLALAGLENDRTQFKDLENDLKVLYSAICNYLVTAPSDDLLEAERRISHP